MLRKLIYSTDKKIMIIGAFLLLIALLAVPVPSVITFNVIENDLHDSSLKLNGYSRETVEQVEMEKQLSRELESLTRQMERRFEGINSDLRLRNIILKLCDISDISTSSCKLSGTSRLTEADGMDSGFKKGIHAATLELAGAAYLEDLLIFVNTLESLNIGLQVDRFSTARIGGFMTPYTFLMTLTGYFVTEEASGTVTDRKGS